MADLRLSPGKLDLLIHGYCRSNASKIISHLNNICSKYLNTWIYLKFPKKTNGASEKQTITFDDYYFNFYVESKPYELSLKDHPDNTIEPLLTVSTDKEDIHSIIISYRIVCLDNNSEWRGSEEVRFNKEVFFGNYDILRSSQIKNFDNLSELQFAINIEILSVESNDMHYEYQDPDMGMCLDGCYWTDNELLKLNAMPEITKYEWIIDKTTLNMLKECNYSKYIYSDAFGNGAFCLCLTPRGPWESNRHKAFIDLRLLNLPYRVKFISTITKITSKCMEKPIDQFDQCFIFRNDSGGCGMNRKLCLREKLFGDEHLKINVEIEIRQLWVYPGCRAHYGDWNWYGIELAPQKEARKWELDLDFMQY
eukprot:200460_1